jgi:uncharacterized membrane protein YvbJ
MVYCSKCGTQISEGASFCPNCGTKVVAGAAAATPSDEMRDALTKMSIEMEKAFNVAAKQVQEAFKTARNNVQKAVYKEPKICPDCGEKNPSYATYCFKCGKRLSATEPVKVEEPAEKQQEEHAAES